MAGRVLGPTGHTRADARRIPWHCSATYVAWTDPHSHTPSKIEGGGNHMHVPQGTSDARGFAANAAPRRMARLMLAGIAIVAILAMLAPSASEVVLVAEPLRMVSPA